MTDAALKKTGNKIWPRSSRRTTSPRAARSRRSSASSLAGKVLVSGQDAELEGARRIVQGTQAMTVYKPLAALARMAANNAVRLAKGDGVDAGSTTVNNGKKDVPARLLDPIPVDKNNLDGLLINDGFHTQRADLRQGGHRNEVETDAIERSSAIAIDVRRDDVGALGAYASMRRVRMCAYGDARYLERPARRIRDPRRGTSTRNLHYSGVISRFSS